MTRPLSKTWSNSTVANWRATTSVASRHRPSVKNNQVWSRLIMVSAKPVIPATWVLTNER